MIMSQTIKQCVRVSAGLALLMSVDGLCLTGTQENEASVQDIPADVLSEAIMPFAWTSDPERSNAFRGTSRYSRSVTRIMTPRENTIT